MPLNKERDELDAARLLPVYVCVGSSVCLPYESLATIVTCRPMYILFVQVKGYSEAVGK